MVCKDIHCTSIINLVARKGEIPHSVHSPFLSSVHTDCTLSSFSLVSSLKTSQYCLQWVLVTLQQLLVVVVMVSRVWSDLQMILDWLVCTCKHYHVSFSSLRYILLFSSPSLIIMADISKLKPSMEGILLPDVAPKCKWSLDKTDSSCPNPHTLNPPR